MTTTLIVILICLLLSAFFSGMEIAFLTSNKLRIEIDKGNKGIAQSLIDLFVSNSGMYITTILVGNNVVMVIYGIFMSGLLVRQLEFLHLSVGLQLFVETVISTLIILVFAEFLPKTVFRLRSNLFLRIFAVPVFLFYLLFFPLSYFSVWLGGILLRLFTGKKLEQKEPSRAFGKIDLNNLIEEGENGAKEKEEMHEIRLFRNALDFSEVKLRECIVPRPDVVALPIDSTIEELSRLFIETGLSRILIYKDSIDDIIGYIHSSELFKNPEDWTQSIKTVSIVPETMAANKLMKVLMQDKKSLAVVVDEFGGTAGIVTLEDLVEEIFGEIEDEHDMKSYVARKVSDDEYLISGRMEIDTLNEKFNLELPESDDYVTIAGYILHFYQKFPKLNESIVIDKYTFKIIKVTATKIELVRMKVGN